MGCWFRLPITWPLYPTTAIAWCALKPAVRKIRTTISLFCMEIDFMRLLVKDLETQPDEFCIHLTEFPVFKAWGAAPWLQFKHQYCNHFVVAAEPGRCLKLSTATQASRLPFQITGQSLLFQSYLVQIIMLCPLAYFPFESEPNCRIWLQSPHYCYAARPRCCHHTSKLDYLSSKSKQIDFFHI